MFKVPGLVPFRRAVTLSIAVSAALGAAASQAQQASTGPALTEIIVTAQKREQNIQDVPISVQALSGQQLKDAGVTDIKNLTVLTPGLTVTSTTSENVTTARIRGIGTVGDNPGLESSVGVVIDGVYRPRNGVGFGNLGEIERIEVLEGPQGELFGKNNDAGVINIVTKRPSTTFGVTAEATYGNYNDKEFSAAVTGPIGGISAARLYVGYQKRDGFEDVLNGVGPSEQNNANDRNFYTLRGQYSLTPTDALSILFIADYSKRNEVCCAAVQTTDGPLAGIINALTGVPALGGNGSTGLATPPDAFHYRAYANQEIHQRIQDEGFSAQVDWDLNFAKLTSITAWRDNILVAGNDVDYSAADIVQEPDTQGNQTDFKQFSQELRLGGKTGPLDWLVGGFFSSELLTTGNAIFAGDQFEPFTGGLASAAGTGVPNFGLIPGITGKPFGDTFVPGVAGEADFYHQSEKSYALFTNETYNITKALDITGGLRYTIEKKTANSNYVDPDGGAGCGALLPTIAATNPVPVQNQFLFALGCASLFDPLFAGHSTSQSLNESNVSGTLKVAYHFTEDVMTYVSWANGFKAGGFNLARATVPSSLTPIFDTEFPRETVSSWEAGIKSELANRTVRLNASIFDAKYTNFQLNTYTGLQFVVSTLRNVSSKGVELNSSWATPVSGLTLSGGVTYAFTNIDNFGNGGPGAPNDPAQELFAANRLNNRLSFAPLWSGVASANYTIPLSSTLEVRATVSDKYTSSYNTGSDLDPEKLQTAYGLLNARLGVGSPDGKWTVEVWGNNLADKGYYQVAFDAPFQYQQIDAFLGDPRTFGMTFRTKF